MKIGRCIHGKGNIRQKFQRDEFIRKGGFWTQRNVTKPNKRLKIPGRYFAGRNSNQYYTDYAKQGRNC